jgi:hypothetical protein
LNLAIHLRAAMARQKRVWETLRNFQAKSKSGSKGSFVASPIARRIAAQQPRLVAGDGIVVYGGQVRDGPKDRRGAGKEQVSKRSPAGF